MRAMSIEAASDLSQFRVTLFVGPQAVEGEPFTYSTVFNVKKRSWKGGIQVAVELRQDQIEAARATVHFTSWLTRSLASVPTDERPTVERRAQELFIEALCRSKLDILLRSGLTPENQSLKAGTWSEEWASAMTKRASFIITYVATELDVSAEEAES